MGLTKEVYESNFTSGAMTDVTTNKIKMSSRDLTQVTTDHSQQLTTTDTTDCNDPSVASMRVQSWGDEVLKEVGYGEGCAHREYPFPTGEESGGKFFLFCDLKMAYFGEFWGTKFKVFLYRELPQWGLGQFCGKFWIFEQKNE